MIRIVTDSTADLPAGIIEQYNITVVPLLVHFGDEEFLDWVELSPEEFYEKLATSRVLPRTSQPSPNDFLETYRAVSDPGDIIISIHISAALSGTYQSAVLASKECVDREVIVIDSKLASMGLGITVLEAAKSVNSGAPKELVLSVVSFYLQNTRLYFAVNTLEYLHKNGRIGKASALLGSMLSVKPILTLQNGIIVPKEQMRGRKKALEKLVNILKQDFSSFPRVKIAVVHGNAHSEAVAIEKQLESLFSFDEIIVSSIGAVIGTHVGPGLIGIVMCNEKQ